MNTLFTIVAVIIAVFILLFILVLIIRRKNLSKVEDTGSTQVYVGNLSYSLRDHQLKDVFEKYGDISSVRIIKHPQSRRSKGFGFITFDSVKSVKKSLKMHGKELNGRTIVVRVANPRES